MRAPKIFFEMSCGATRKNSRPTIPIPPSRESSWAAALSRQQRYSDAEVESRAGYEILIKQTSPSTNWLQNARQDLAEEYTALNRPADTAKFKAELALGGVAAAAARTEAQSKSRRTGKC